MEATRIQQANEVPKWDTCIFTPWATLKDGENIGIPKVSLLRLPVVYAFYPPLTNEFYTYQLYMFYHDSIPQHINTNSWNYSVTAYFIASHPQRALNPYQYHCIQQFFRIIPNNSKHLHLKEIPLFS